MKRTLLLLTLVGATLLACSGVVLAQSTNRPDNQPQPQDANKRYIVVLNEDVSDVPAVAEEHRQNGAQPRHLYQSALKGYSATLPDAAVAGIERDPRVQLVDKDLPVKADQSSSATGGATGVDRVDAEPNSATAADGSGAGVAVIDTGIDETHPDLSPNVVKGINTISPSGRTTSSGGTVNCTSPSTSTLTTDDNGHGTHVAGTIAAKNDGTGVVGVAPGATLYAAKVLNSQGSGYRSDIICGIDWVTNNAKDANGTQKIHAANMSLGGTGSDDNKTCTEEIASPTDAYKKAICGSVKNSGVTYVVSAGNDGANLANKTPAAYRDGTNPLVLTVTAMSDSDGLTGGTGGAPSCRTGEKDDYPATFSNYATTTVDEDHTIPAPGVCIKSTWKGGAYKTISGTSMASPHIAGTVALCLRSEGSCASAGATSPDQILNKLRTDAQTKDTNDGKYGFQGDPTSSPTSGRYYGYLEYAGDYRSGSSGGTTPPPSSDPPPADTTPPETTITSGPVQGSTTGSSSPSFSFSSSESGSTFECRLDSTSDSDWSDCSSPKAYSKLSSGLHTFEVRATDSAGNTDQSPASRKWTIKAKGK